MCYLQFFATRTGNTFDLRASGKSLLLSASQLPHPYSFVKSDTHKQKALQKCRKPLSRMARRAKQTWSPQIFWRWLFIHSHIVSGALRRLNCDKGPTVANQVFSLITFDVVLKAVCQLLESFDYIQVLLQSKQARDTFLFVCFNVYKWYFLRICSVKEIHSTYVWI